MRSDEEKNFIEIWTCKFEMVTVQLLMITGRSVRAQNDHNDLNFPKNVQCYFDELVLVP